MRFAGRDDGRVLHQSRYVETFSGEALPEVILRPRPQVRIPSFLGQTEEDLRSYFVVACVECAQPAVVGIQIVRSGRKPNCEYRRRAGKSDEEVANRASGAVHALRSEEDG